MRILLADAVYWAAVFNPRDQFHTRSLDVSRALGDVRLVTTEEILTEVLSLLSSRQLRHVAVSVVREIMTNPQVEVIPQSHHSFLAGLSLFEQRPDRGYSLVDCVSMHVMRSRGLHDVLTYDHHFEQEGFVALLRAE